MIRWKDLRKRGVSSVSSFGLVCSALPFWAITFSIFYFRTTFVLSEKYFLNLSIWAILCIITNLGSLFILKFKALSELGIYKLALSTLIAILIDIIFLKNTLNTITLFGVILLLTSGFLLPTKKNNKKHDIKLSTTLLLLLFLSFAGTIQYTAYKNSLLLQASPILHAMFAQLVLYTIFLGICFKNLKKDYSIKKIKINDIIFFGILIYIYTVIEAFLFKELPITLLISLTVLNILLFQIYDVKNKELKHSWRLYLSALLASAAIIIIMFK